MHPHHLQFYNLLVPITNFDENFLSPNNHYMVKVLKYS